MQLPRGKRYHDWEATTPIVDVVVQFLVVVAVFIGCYAVLFAAMAVRDGNYDQLLGYGAFLAAGALAVGAGYVFRHWRRHNA